MESKNKIYLLLVAAAAIWGGTFVAGKILSGEVRPLTAAFWRFFIASLVLAPLAAKSREGLWPKALPAIVWVKLILLGASGMLAYNYFFIKGLGLTSAGRGSVITATNPSLTFLGTIFIFGEKCTKSAVLGVACALAGAAVAVSHGHILNLFEGEVGLGEALLFGCAVSWATYSLLGKSVLGVLTPLTSTTWACICGAALLLPLALMESGPSAFLNFSPTAWTCLAFLGVLGTSAGFTWFYRGIVAIGARQASIFINLVPIFGIIFGSLYFGEKVDASLLIGLALALSGIALINRKS